MPADIGRYNPREQGHFGEPWVLLSGPPLSGALFREVQRRLLPQRTVVLDLIAPEAASLGLPGLSAALAEALRGLGARRVLAHGAAVPVALGLGAEHLDWLALSNGPVGRADPVTRALAALPERVLAQLLLRPGVLNRWLASSVGLRRTVVNPYVMERDIVVLLTEPWTRSAEARLAAARWIRALAGPLPAQAAAGVRTGLFWGDADPLHPIAGAQVLAAGALVRLPGGRAHHPEEMPWALADALAAWAGEGVVRATAT